MVIYLGDGTFCPLPTVVFAAHDEWDYPTFLTELLIFLSGTHLRSRILFEELQAARQVSRDSIRIFIVPLDFSAALHFTCALICGNCLFLEEYLSYAFSEMTWGGCARAFSLHAVISPSDLCQFLIIIRHGLRRDWAVIGSTPSVQLSIEATRYLVNELYRSIMP
jgi:hypothetical protein